MMGATTMKIRVLVHPWGRITEYVLLHPRFSAARAIAAPA